MRKICSIMILIFCITVTAQEKKDNSTDLLLNANAISVTIGGNFPVTGTFPSFINERVDQFVTRIYSQAVMNLRPWEVIQYSFRNIKLKRLNSEDITLDLIKFRRTGDFANNPYLRQDDVLLFPSTDIERNFVSVSGAVMEPDKFHFVDGDRVSDILALAGGLNKAYENMKIKVYRLNYDGENSDIIEVSEDFELQRGDRIIVEAEETSKKEYNITVVGEVNIPGVIPISKNSTTLTEVIKRAGGLKETASLKHSRLFTGSKSEFVLNYIYGMKVNQRWFDAEQEERLTQSLINLEGMRMYRLSGITYEDTAYFAIENELRILTEGTRIDLSKIKEDSVLSSFIVKDGDVLVIPKKPTSVYVFGSVANPGHVHFAYGKEASYYLDLAGGMGDFARKDDAMVIKGNTREWIAVEKNPVIEEGDYIFVPRDEPRAFSYYVDMTAKYFGILGGIATVILLFLQF